MFLDELRDMALTESKIEELEQEVKALKETVFNDYVDAIVNAIKDEIKAKVQRGEYLKSGGKNSLKSVAGYSANFYYVVDKDLIQRLEAANYKRLLNQKDGYVCESVSINCTQVDRLYMQLIEFTQKRYEALNRTYYYSSFPQKKLVKKLIKAVKDKLAEDSIKIMGIGGYFSVDWYSDSRKGVEKIYFSDLDVEKPICPVSDMGGSYRIYLPNTKIWFIYSVTF